MLFSAKLVKLFLFLFERNGTDMNKQNDKFPVNLFCSLMLLSFIPFFYTIVRTNLIVNRPAEDAFGIAGHIPSVYKRTHG